MSHRLRHAGPSAQKRYGSNASDILTPLILDFLAWLEATPRPYAEVMDAWRTSCPRLTIWEDALDAGLVAHLRAPGALATAGVTDKGRKMLEARSKGVA